MTNRRRGGSWCWLSLLLVFLCVTGALAGEAGEEDREQRWHRLHQGFTHEYIEECLARRDLPGWSLEDETDLAMGFWWLMAEDYRNREVQDQLFTAVDHGISHCRDTVRESCPPIRHALMGNLIIMASQVQVARGNYLSAARYAREGQRILEGVRRADPDIGDTYFSLGLYLYYVDLSSPLVRGLQRILFFPPGDSKRGLLYLEKAALQSRRFGPMARLALANIYSSDEEHYGQALSHLRTLRRQYPDNPLFIRFMAKALSEVGQFAQARDLLDEAERKISRKEPPFREYHRDVFRIIRAELDLKSFILDKAYNALTAVIHGDGGGPSWVRPVAANSLARLYVLSGDDAGYTALLRMLSREEEDGRYRKRIKKLPAKLRGQGYDDDLHQVFRHWIAGDHANAIQKLSRLKEIKGNTGLLSYLMGEVLLQQGDTPDARQQFREYLSLGSEATPLAAGWSMIHLGDIEAGHGDLDAAGHYYRQAVALDEFSDRHVARQRLDVLVREKTRRAGGRSE